MLTPAAFKNAIQTSEDWGYIYILVDQEVYTLVVQNFQVREAMLLKHTIRMILAPMFSSIQCLKVKHCEST